jgi:hypothetical protein
MKRWLLPASALVLVVTACGAGTRPAPRVTEVGARVPSVPAVVLRRERVAQREARTLLGELLVPRGARRDPTKRNHGGILHQSGRATTEIRVRTPAVSLEVKDPASVARIVRWFDALPTSPPGIGVACTLRPSPQRGI